MISRLRMSPRDLGAEQKICVVWEQDWSRNSNTRIPPAKFLNSNINFHGAVKLTLNGYLVPGLTIFVSTYATGFQIPVARPEIFKSFCKVNLTYLRLKGNCKQEFITKENTKIQKLISCTNGLISLFSRSKEFLSRGIQGAEKTSSTHAPVFYLFPQLNIRAYQ